MCSSDLLFTLHSLLTYRADERDAGSETIFRADCTDIARISTDGSWKSAVVIGNEMTDTGYRHGERYHMHRRCSVGSTPERVSLRRCFLASLRLHVTIRFGKNDAILHAI